MQDDREQMPQKFQPKRISSCQEKGKKNPKKSIPATNIAELGSPSDQTKNQRKSSEKPS